MRDSSFWGGVESFFRALFCRKLRIVLPAPAEPEGAKTFRAGVARVDITPTPGVPMGGYAAGGKLARGVWLRLYARAFAFEDGEGQALAMVSCDLWSIPGGLADRVAELVAAHPQARVLGREQIVVAATHTHNSPGNYSSSMLYNALGSPGKGFDRRLFDFLAGRIAAAIVEAWKQRKPATLTVGRSRLGEIARNRSFKPFQANGMDAQAILAENHDLPVMPTPFPVDPQAYRAFDPTLTTIRIHDRSPARSLQGVLAFYAVHPTAAGPRTEVYSSDLFGVATTLLERKVFEGGAIFALFNGASGDVSSNWREQERRSVLELGQKLAAGIRDNVAEAGEGITGDIRFAFQRLQLEGQPGIPAPMAGAAMFGGSENDWIFLRDAGYREGLVKEQSDGRPKAHEPKMEPLDPSLVHLPRPFLGWHWDCLRPFRLSKLIDAVMRVPRVLPLGVYRIGPLMLCTLPGEFTTVLGRRIAAKVARAAGQEHRPLLIGLANEYVSYFTTPEEHALQHYEGGSTLFGPSAGEKIGDALAELARALVEQENPPARRAVEETVEYSPGWGHEFGVKQLDFLRHLSRFRCTHETLANLLAGDRMTTNETLTNLLAGEQLIVPDNPFFVWVDDDPKWEGIRTLTTPAVRIQRARDDRGERWEPLVVDGAEEADTDLRLVTTVVGSLAGETRWNATWMAPPGVPSGELLRFEVVTTSRKTIHSKGFTLAGLARDRARMGFVDLVWANE